MASLGERRLLDVGGMCLYLSLGDDTIRELATGVLASARSHPGARPRQGVVRSLPGRPDRGRLADSGMSPLTPGCPGGKYLGRRGPLTTAELHEVLADVRDQLEREPAILDQLGEAILSRDLTTTADILVHLRGFFDLITALLQIVTVTDTTPGRAA